MATNINIEYNHLNAGPRVVVFGEKPILVYWFNEINGVKKMVNAEIVQPGYWFQISRQWYSNWIIEAYEWNQGNLLKIKEDKFNPYGKRIHFHLDEFGSLEEHQEYIKACIDFVSHWSLESYVVESPHAHELLKQYPGFSISHKIMDEDCYKSFLIKKTPSDCHMWENFKTWGLNEEFVFFNHNHPENPEDQTSYEFARSILFGPDYKKLNEWVPCAGTLNERVVS